ncbi:MAG: DNA polymerase subunit beta [Anaerolineae bacterium]|nr:DNA polymerase subunit beta [Anaerolineae bacterium]
MTGQIDIPWGELPALCRKWRVRELSLFGSALREDFSPESDVDVLVSFDPGAPWDLWDLIEMQGDLERLFARPVDLVEREVLRNPWRREEILRTRRVLLGSWAGNAA